MYEELDWTARAKAFNTHARIFNKATRSIDPHKTLPRIFNERAKELEQTNKEVQCTSEEL